MFYVFGLLLIAAVAVTSKLASSTRCIFARIALDDGGLLSLSWTVDVDQFGIWTQKPKEV